MREISCEEISAAAEMLCIRAASFLTPDLAMQLECASESEPNPAGRGALEDIVENFTAAGLHGLPVCRRADVPVVFARIGQEVHITGGSFAAAVDTGVRRGYAGAGLCAGAAYAPLCRESARENVPAVLHTELVPGDGLQLTVALTCADCENACAVRMFPPGTSREQVEDWIVQTAAEAGARPCPPVVVGVGAGGNFEQAALLARRALIRPVDRRSAEPFYAAMERRTLAKINRLGIGPRGRGGRTTAVAVNVETAPAGAAGLPCAVCIGCHATRHADCAL